MYNKSKHSLNIHDGRITNLKLTLVIVVPINDMRIF